jgi:hypothetical protein
VRLSGGQLSVTEPLPRASVRIAIKRNTNAVAKPKSPPHTENINKLDAVESPKAYLVVRPAPMRPAKNPPAPAVQLLSHPHLYRRKANSIGVATSSSMRKHGSKPVSTTPSHMPENPVQELAKCLLNAASDKTSDRIVRLIIGATT